jgi:hypothetical protein
VHYYSRDGRRIVPTIIRVSGDNKSATSDSGINNFNNDRMTMQQAIFNQFFLINISVSSFEE